MRDQGCFRLPVRELEADEYSRESAEHAADDPGEGEHPCIPERGDPAPNRRSHDHADPDEVALVHRYIVAPLMISH